jgi:hypothetical protein
MNESEIEWKSWIMNENEKNWSIDDVTIMKKERRNSKKLKKLSMNANEIR